MISIEYIIKDWGGYRVYEDETFNTFDEAEAFLCEFFMKIGADYEEERKDFFIIRKTIEG